MDTILKLIEGAETAAFAVGVLSIFFEVSKIKLNPLTALCTWIGERINSGTEKKLDAIKQEVEALDKKIEKVDEKVDHSDVNRLRWEILNFAAECRQGQHHTRDQFVHVIESNTEYHTILAERGEKNGVLDAEYKYILDIYDHCLHDNDFL